MPEAGVAARIPARPKRAVANRPNHHHQALSLRLRGLDLMVEVAVEARVRPTVDLVMETARREMVVEVETETTETEVVVVVVEEMEVQDSALKTLSRWRVQLTVLIWEDWSFN
jgi:hypothetical protein